jgi:NADH:ubiquinone oxidoreductase subunit 5 (subunit L)/multisubunit Na+/H+ antiporter MnhA subunit
LFFIIYFPFVISLLTGFCGRWFGVHGSRVLSNVGLFMNLIITVLSGLVIFNKQFFFYSSFLNWITLDGLRVDWAFCFDNVSLIMFVVVNSVSCVVHLFSSSYMATDPHVVRFMSYISFFTMFMLLLVTGDTFLQLFLGWEGAGLCSYLLISFWYTRIDAVNSGIKALIVNRISDFLFLCSLLLFCIIFCSMDFSIILAVIDFFVFNYFYISYGFLF